MQQRTKIILFVVSTLLSALYILLTYFGVLRYFQLQLTRAETYIRNYAQLDPASEQNRVVIVLTVPIENIRDLQSTINSLLDQTTRVNEIAVHVIGDGQQILPYYLGRAAQVYRLPHGNGLYQTLLREKEDDTKIILVDSAVIYGKDFVELMVAESEQHPQQAIAAKNALLVTPEMYQVLEGVEEGLDENVELGAAVELIERGLSIHQCPYRENYRVL